MLVDLGRPAPARAFQLAGAILDKPALRPPLVFFRISPQIAAADLDLDVDDAQLGVNTEQVALVACPAAARDGDEASAFQWAVGESAGDLIFIPVHAELYGSILPALFVGWPV